jgi:6-pyruvoyltetrahydropterin/6-carboxytetrahydropterin synthase
MELRKTFRFEASHILPKHKGKCSRLHGHSWVLHVFVKGQVSRETGFVMDYADISGVVKPLVDSLDHRHLGAWTDLFYRPMSDWHRNNMVENMPEDFYPSSENLLVWIAGQLSGRDYPLLWSKLSLEETCTSYAEITYSEWLSLRGASKATGAMDGCKFHAALGETL